MMLYTNLLILSQLNYLVQTIAYNDDHMPILKNSSRNLEWTK